MLAHRVLSPIFALCCATAFLLCETATLRAESPTVANPAAPIKTSLRGIFRTAVMKWLDSSGNRIKTKYGIELDEKSLAAPAEKPLVIVIHGYNSCPQRMSVFSELVRAAGYPCGTFCYPNDQAIVNSAALLSAELKKLAARFPTRRIALLTHSMGGLVARETIENPETNPGNVSQLVMIAPPSHGTTWAYVGYSSDLWECTRGDRCFLDRVYGSFEDGTGEARYDLQPTSTFLKSLNDRPRNPSVHYSMFLGTGTKFSRASMEHAHQVVDRCCETDRFLAIIKPALDCAMCDLEDAVDIGDGVVSVARGKLDGVDDTTLLGFDHWNVIREPDSEAVRTLHGEILARLANTKQVASAQVAPAPAETTASR